jgi:hypothetical protein
MFQRIRDLVIHSFSNTQYPKAILCLQTLRIGCVQHEEATLFNDGLNSLRTLVETKYAEFWKLMQQEQIYPIDQTEVAESTITQEQAKQVTINYNTDIMLHFYFDCFCVVYFSNVYLLLCICIVL